jgi:hypothetical protein
MRRLGDSQFFRWQTIVTCIGVFCEQAAKALQFCLHARSSFQRLPRTVEQLS